MAETPIPINVALAAGVTKQKKKEAPQSVDKRISQEERAQIEEDSMRELQRAEDEIREALEEVQSAFDAFARQVSERYTRLNPDRYEDNTSSRTHSAAKKLYEARTRSFSARDLKAQKPKIEGWQERSLHTEFEQLLKEHCREEYGSSSKAGSKGDYIMSEMHGHIRNRVVNPLVEYANEVTTRFIRDSQEFTGEVRQQNSRESQRLDDIDRTGRLREGSTIRRMYREVQDFEQEAVYEARILERKINEIAYNLNSLVNRRSTAMVGIIIGAYVYFEQQPDGV